MKIILFLILYGSCVLTIAAQQPAQDGDDVQSWNDVQLSVPMSKQFDFYTALTLRFGKNITRLNDERYAFGFVYKPNKYLSIQPFYWHINARNARSRFRTEQRLNLRVAYRFPFKRFGLVHRSTFERRMRSPQNSWRYRPSLTFEKDVPKNIIPEAKFFVTEEVFYDSIPRKFSRNRFSVGITKTITKKLSVDVFYMRQNDGFARPGNLNVVGTGWKVRL